MKTLNQLIGYLAAPRGLNNIYGLILQQAQQQIREDIPAPAAVTVTPLGVWQLFWNPKMLDEEPLTYQLLVLIHEAAHLSLNHTSRGLRLLRHERGSSQFPLRQKQFQYAADLAVNSLVIDPLLTRSPLFKSLSENVRERWLFPCQFNLPEKKSLEAYYHTLQDNDHLPEPTSSTDRKTSKDSAGGGSDAEEPTQGDNRKPSENSAGGGSDAEEPTQGNRHEPAENSEGGGAGPYDDVMVGGILEKPDSTVTQTIRTAEKEALHRLQRCLKISQKNRGTIPHHIQEEINYLDAEPEIPWTSVLRDYAQTALAENITECVASPNAGFLHLSEFGCEPFPGYTLDTTLNVAVLVDASGSINTETDYKPFLRELAHLLDTHKGLNIHYIVFDAVIHEELQFTSEGRDDLLKHRLNTRPATGGTSFLPPFRCAFGAAETDDYASHLRHKRPTETQRPDLIIVMTDGFAPFDYPAGPHPHYLNDEIPNVWVLTKHHSKIPEHLNKMQRIITL